VNYLEIKGNIRLEYSFLKKILNPNKDGVLDCISLEKENI
tara:strand:+ start:310 stop:429 length:120 start_codon:yes stop_codon:yes gene_type:complete